MRFKPVDFSSFAAFTIGCPEGDGRKKVEEKERGRLKGGTPNG